MRHPNLSIPGYFQNQLDQHHANLPEAPGLLPVVLPGDEAVFWQALDQKGWSRRPDPENAGEAQKQHQISNLDYPPFNHPHPDRMHTVGGPSYDGMTFLTFVLYHCPERMGEALGLTRAHPDCITIVNQRDPSGHHEGWTVLQWAARLAQGQAWVPALLELGADPDSRLGYQADHPRHCGTPPLLFVSMAFNSQLTQYYRKDESHAKSAMQALLNAGANPRLCDDDDLTPLHTAAQMAPFLLPILLSHPDAITLVNQKDRFENTPTMRALVGAPEGALALMEAGAHPLFPITRPGMRWPHALALAQSRCNEASFIQGEDYEVLDQVVTAMEAYVATHPYDEGKAEEESGSDDEF